jgi:hypothetical protein
MYESIRDSVGEVLRAGGSEVRFGGSCVYHEKESDKYIVEHNGIRRSFLTIEDAINAFVAGKFDNSGVK